MDPEIAALAGTGASTLVKLLTTDGWHLVKERFASLWRHVQPERATVIAGELEATRDELLNAQNDGDPRTYYSCCFPICGRAEAKRDIWVPCWWLHLVTSFRLPRVRW